MQHALVSVIGLGACLLALVHPRHVVQSRHALCRFAEHLHMAQQQAAVGKLCYGDCSSGSKGSRQGTKLEAFKGCGEIVPNRYSISGPLLI